MNPRRSASNDELSKAVSWLQKCIVSDARGDGVITSDRAPSTLYWLGRLAPECEVLSNRLGDRGERLEPCAIGMRLRPIATPPWNLTADISMHAWSRTGKANPWTKSDPIALTLHISISPQNKRIRLYQAELEDALRSATSRSDLGAAIDISTEVRNGVIELVIELVNVSEPSNDSQVDCNIYECSLQVKGLRTQAFTLEGLPDAFRYNRDLPAIGLNCSVYTSGDGVLKTTDTPETAQLRPNFVPEGIDEELLSFHRLTEDPGPSANALVHCHTEWGKRNWSQEILSARAEAEHWTIDMIEAASQARAAFLEENRRLADGAALLHSNDELRLAFALMNDAMARSARGRYPGWRAFQLGFLLANLRCIEAFPEESDIADIVWFATGGGKTETYLGLLIIAMIRDRMRGKLAGITAWSRFPLRMLSLQQTQRFADAIAAAELVRRDNKIPGSPFSLGFFVGQGATPNAISPEPEEGHPNPYDDEMPKRFQVLGRCPFCGSESLEMAFDQTSWALQHRCTQVECPWPEMGLPFYVVDEEIYRFLPTVVVGTLDKAASISMQAAMRGFVGSPLGVCSKPGHGFTYAVRSKRPTGCLVPGCRHPLSKLTNNVMDFAPSFRLQDELHLLRDSLGAVDAHYEALYDHLSYELSNRRPKILGSSATLAGYERQVSVLYAREARVFPQPGPAPGVGFWSSESQSLMRHFVALAPRGVTLEHAIDRTMTVLQRSIRRLADQPEIVAAEIGIPTEIAWQVIDLYGTNVVYGNTLRDLDAVSRSAETQILVDGDVIQRSLTGRTDFAEVRQTLRDLEEPPVDFKSRVHVVMASSMMSHGVDIDRLNVMVMVGLPLGTAEFIQATARVGRRYPGLVIVAPKMGRERDAAVYRTFPKFVEHADRLVEPIPITRRSRRVLQRTMAGLEMARILMIHEPASGRSLALPRELRKYWDSIGFDLDAESRKLIEALDLTGELDGPLHREVQQWMEGFMRNLNDPPADVRFVSQASPSSGPMRSLRDVEESVSIYGKEESR